MTPLSAEAALRVYAIVLCGCDVIQIRHLFIQIRLSLAYYGLFLESVKMMNSTYLLSLPLMPVRLVEEVNMDQRQGRSQRKYRGVVFYSILKLKYGENLKVVRDYEFLLGAATPPGPALINGGVVMSSSPLFPDGNRGAYWQQRLEHSSSC